MQFQGVPGGTPMKPPLRLLWHGTLASTVLWSCSDSSLQRKTQCVPWEARQPGEFYRANIKVASGMSVSYLTQILKSTGIYGLCLPPSNVCFHDYLVFPSLLPLLQILCDYISHPPGNSNIFSLSQDSYLHHLYSLFAIDGNIGSCQCLWPGYLGGHYSTTEPKMPPGCPLSLRGPS